MEHETELFRSLGKIEATLAEVANRVERMERNSEREAAAVKEDHDSLRKRVAELEKWRTYLIGSTVGTLGMVVGAFVILNHALNALKGVATIVRP